MRFWYGSQTSRNANRLTRRSSIDGSLSTTSVMANPFYVTKSSYRQIDLSSLRSANHTGQQGSGPFWNTLLLNVAAYFVAEENRIDDAVLSKFFWDSSCDHFQWKSMMVKVDSRHNFSRGHMLHPTGLRASTTYWSLLHIGRNKQATLAVDKVFSLYPILAHIFHSTFHLDPSYSMSSRQVFVKTTTFAIECFSDLSCLYFVPGLHGSNSDLPSWTPNFALPARRPMGFLPRHVVDD